MYISVIGTGYVGLVTGACFAEFGLHVTCMDIDAQRIERLEKGDVPFYEPGLSELVMKGLRENRLTFTTDIKKAVERALVIFIAVGTPTRSDGSADLSYVEEVGRGIAKSMTGYKVIATKSTVPVGTGEKIRQVIRTNQTSPCRFDIISNPEFLREGSAIEDFMRPNRVVIGADSDHAIAIMKDLYRPLYLIETPIVVTDIPTAEMIKYASNAFLAVKISFINEIANLCERVHADVQVVAKAMGLDRRIGPKFLHAGPGFGGSCFPKDVSALIQTGEKVGYEMQIARAAATVNERQRLLMVEKIQSVLGGLQGKTVGVLGISFKPNTSDLRESPALTIIERLLAGGCTVRAFDPASMDEGLKLLPKMIPCADAYEVAKGSDALILITEWNQFRNLDLEQLKGALRQPLFIDLRNVYEADRMAAAGFRYISVGRPPREPQGRS
jgi:UDPglucose 6-dehydrogenase